MNTLILLYCMKGAHQLERAAAEEHVDAYLQTLPSQRVHTQDMPYVRHVLMELTHAQEYGVPRLQYNVKRVADEYTITAAGYTRFLQGTRLSRTLLGRARSDLMMTVMDFAVHPADRAVVVYMYRATLETPPDLPDARDPAEDERRAAQRQARAFLERLGLGVVRSLDRTSIEAVLAELVMAQPGAPELEFSVHLMDNHYTVAASGYTGSVRGLRLTERLVSRQRVEELRQVTQWGMHPDDRALTVRVDSIAPHTRGRTAGGLQSEPSAPEEDDRMLTRRVRAKRW